MERKFISISEFKGLDEGNGFLRGYPSVFGDIDSYGDIILQGAFKDSIASFEKSGFNCHSHDWSFKELVGYPVRGTTKEDEYGLYSEMAFHSTPDVQIIRTKAIERRDAGLDVGLSIGYMVDRSMIFYINAKDYDAELPKYIKPEFLQGCRIKAKKYPRLRVLAPSSVNLKEYSLVTAPAQDIAQSSEVKDMTNIETKGHFSERIEQYMTISALECASNSLWYNIIWSTICDESLTPQEKADKIGEAIDEYKALVQKVILAILTAPDVDAEEIGKQIRATWEDPEVKKLGDPLTAITLNKHLTSTLSAVKNVLRRVEEVKAKRLTDGKDNVSEDNREPLAHIGTEALSLSKSIEEILTVQSEPEGIDMAEVNRERAKSLKMHDRVKGLVRK